METLFDDCRFYSPSEKRERPDPLRQSPLKARRTPISWFTGGTRPHECEGSLSVTLSSTVWLIRGYHPVTGGVPWSREHSGVVVLGVFIWRLIWDWNRWCLLVVQVFLDTLGTSSSVTVFSGVPSPVVLDGFTGNLVFFVSTSRVETSPTVVTDPYLYLSSNRGRGGLVTTLVSSQKGVTPDHVLVWTSVGRITKKYHRRGGDFHSSNDES